MSLVVLITFMDRISRCSRVIDSVRFRILVILSLLFADDVVLLASLNSDLWFRLGQFESETPGMKIRASKSESIILSQKTMDCPLVLQLRPPNP